MKLLPYVLLALTLFTALGPSIYCEYVMTKNAIVVNFVLNIPTELNKAGFDLRNAKLFVQVFAIQPKNTSVEIYRGVVRDRLVISLDNPRFRYVVKQWVDYLEKTGMNLRAKMSFRTALIIEATMILPNGDMYRLPPSLTVAYSPVQLFRGLGGVEKTFVIDAHHILTKKNFIGKAYINPKQVLESKDGEHESNISPLTFMCFPVWKPVEELSYVLTNRKIPIAIVSNPYASGGDLQLYITIFSYYTVKFQIGVAIGYQLDTYGLQSPSLEITFGGTSTEIYADLNKLVEIDRGETKYVWIKGDIVSEFYEQYLVCPGYEQPTGTKLERVYISNIEIVGDDIVGGIGNGWPEEASYILEGIEYEFYGFLDPKENVELETIFKDIINEYSSYQGSIAVGIPVGAVLAYYAPIALPQALSNLMKALTVNVGVSWQGMIYLDGILNNLGPQTEQIDIYVTSVEYELSDVCTAKVPVVIIRSI